MIIATLFCCAIVAARADPGSIKVAYLSQSVDLPFWRHFLDVMRAAAEDLNMELRVRFSPNEPDKLIETGMSLLQDGEKPDYFVTGYWPRATDELLEAAEKLHIHTFTVNTDIKDFRATGKPREKFKYWIGHIYPDDFDTGFQLIDILIAQYRLVKTTNQTDKINIIAVSGAPNSPASNFRLAGMKSRIGVLPHTHLHQTLHCYWKSECAEIATNDFLKQYPNTGIIWAASDDLALGAIDAAEKLGYKPGRDIFIGGIDWSPKGLQAVADGALSVTMGGHFIEGAWALVLIHDYHHGVDFTADPGISFETRMSQVTANNVRKFRTVLEDPNWSLVDFGDFSKAHNPALKQYNFKIEEIFKYLMPDNGLTQTQHQ